MENKYLFKKNWRGFLKEVLSNTKVICILVFVLLVIISSVLGFTHERTMTATIMTISTQQLTQGNKDGFMTTYRYLVSTDQGTLQISPDGLMASSCFGTLQEGCTYTMYLRGFSVPFIGLYPYIIEAKEIKQ